MTDSAGAVVNRYDYSPFGVPLLTNETVPNSFRYVGRFGVMEEGNGTQFMRARYYTPQLSRFINPDPILLLRAIDTYDYASNNPLRHVDPLGTSDSNCATEELRQLGLEATKLILPSTITITPEENIRPDVQGLVTNIIGDKIDDKIFDLHHKGAPMIRFIEAWPK